MDNLGRAVKRGVAWMVAGRGIKFAVNAAASIALARMLEPRTFGLFTIASLFIVFTKQLQTFGMAKAAVRLKKLEPAHVSTVFAVNALTSSGLCVALWLAAPLLETLFHEPTAVPVLRLLALGFLANPFGSVGSAILERRMDFKSKSRANVLYSLSKVITSVALAATGWGVWSLAIGQIVGQFTRASALFLPARWFPNLRFSRAALHDLAGFGLGMFVKNTTAYLQERIDYFVVGRWLGAASLGFYERAYRMPDAIVKELGRGTSTVLFSAYSKIQSEPERLRSAFTRVLVSVCLLAYPGLAGVALIAPALIRVVFGTRWDPTVAPLQILCIGGFFRLFAQLSTTLMNAEGHIRAEAAWRLVSVALLGLSSWYASQWGIVGVAAAIVIVDLFVSTALVSVTLRVSSLQLRDLLAPQAPILLATLIMTGAVVLFQTAAVGSLGTHSPPMLLLSIAIGGSTYAASIYLLGGRLVKGVVKELLKEARPFLAKVSK